MSSSPSSVSYDNNNDIRYTPVKMTETTSTPSPLPSENSSGVKIPTKRRDNTGVHLNNLWSVWYGIFGTGVQAYTVVKCTKRILGYSLLYWPEHISIPYLELNCSLGLIGAAVLLLPLFLATALFKVGNLANDGFKLGRQIGTCSKEPPSEVLTHGGRCGLFKHGGPTAPFVHLVIAFCLLIPKLILEAKLIEAGFLSQEWIWKTDLDFMVVHRDRLVILSFMTSNGTNNSPSSITQARIVSATKAPAVSFNPTGLPFSHSMPVTHTVIKTLKEIVGHENHTNYYNNNSNGDWSSSLSVEYLNLVVALMVYSVRYPAIFWSTNKCLGILFSLQLFINSIHTLLGFAGMSILYRVQVVGAWKALPLLKHSASWAYNSNITPFLLNPQVTLALYLMSTLLVLASSLILYLYGHTRFNEFLNQECERRVIMLKRDGNSKWSYFTHCSALCVLVAVGICNAPLLHDYTFVYKGSLDDITLACIISGILHLFLWVLMWLFLTIKQKWIFKLRVVVGRATVRQARSLRLITDIDLSNNPSKDAPDQPLLVVANGRTYGVSDITPQKAIMAIVKKSTTIKKTVSTENALNQDDDEEQIYWLRPALANQASTPDGSKQLCCFIKKTKPKVTFNETASTSNIRCKNNGGKRRVPGMDEDDGDYATLREIPLVTPLPSQMNNNETDSASEEGKLLAYVHDERITYASNNQDLNPPLDYEDPSPLLTPEPLPDLDDPSKIPIPVVVHNCPIQPSQIPQTPRCLRRIDSGMPPEEMNSRSDSISLESSASPPEAPGSNHSETSSGVHSNDSRDQQAKQTRRATSVVDLMQPPAKEEIQWKSSSLQRNVQPPTSSNYVNIKTSPPLANRREVDPSVNVILEDPGEDTVIIRRKSCRSNIPDATQSAVLKEEPFGRATNMRMVSFTEKTDLGNIQSTSATLPHYPTQPLPNVYPNCSTMPLPPHSGVSPNMNSGNSCNIYPRQHSTIPTHHNGVKLFNGAANGATNAHLQNRMLCKQDITSADLIYTRVYRNTNGLYHPT